MLDTWMTTAFLGAMFGGTISMRGRGASWLRSMVFGFIMGLICAGGAYWLLADVAAVA
jgi:hypothetical protein